MEKFSQIGNDVDNQLKEAERLEKLKPVPPFPLSQLSKDKTEKRKKKALEDFWFFDKTYFPKSSYKHGYFEPGFFHRKLKEICDTPGMQIVLAGRDFGKSVTVKKVLMWKLLRNDWSIIAIMSGNKDKASLIMKGIANQFINNARLAHDFKPDFINNSDDIVNFSLYDSPEMKTMFPITEQISAKGLGDVFNRLDAVFCDDLEDAFSSFTKDSVAKREKALTEAKQSMHNKGTMIVLGNNSNVGSVYNHYKTKQEDGLLPSSYKVHVYPAWSAEYGSLWFERFPAQSEKEMKEITQPSDLQNWMGDFQQNPIKEKGFIFTKDPIYYSDLPSDAKGVIYCDPNLSKKSKGDTTAITGILYSPTTSLFYIHCLRCISFSDTGELLDSILEMRQTFTTKRFQLIGFDGNVTQESTWTEHVHNWSKIRKVPYPRIDYRHENVDTAFKTTSSLWNEGKILIHESYRHSPEGKLYCEQIEEFQGKKANNKDDAPDSLICAIEMMYDKKYHRYSSGQKSRVSSVYIPDQYF